MIQILHDPTYTYTHTHIYIYIGIFWYTKPCRISILSSISGPFQEQTPVSSLPGLCEHATKVLAPDKAGRSKNQTLQSQWVIIIGYFKPITVYFREQWPLCSATWPSKTYCNVKAYRIICSNFRDI